MAFIKSPKGKKRQRKFLLIVASLVIISFVSSIFAINFL
jgi:hypothetical protein